MPDDRVFSDEELRLAGLRTVDAIAETVAAGDRATARGLGRRLRREALSMKSNYDAWEAKLLAWTRRRDAEAHAEEALGVVAGAGDAPAPPEANAAGDAPSRWREWAGRIDDALANGRDEEATAVAHDLHDDALRPHHRGMARVAALLSWIGRRYGTDELEEAYEEAMAADLLGDAGFRERAEALMHFTRVHLQPFEIEEDAKKLTFLCAVCPSGGRLLREGHYDPPRAGLRVPGPRWLTWGRDDLPVYCCHEPIMERASILKSGAPLFIVEPSEVLGEEPCRTFLYKDPADIPERYYTRLGLEKPKR
jgi:hypothetical protein